MITVYCDLTECKWNSGESGGSECTRDYLNITDTFHADAPARCEDYVEGEKE